MQDVVSRLIPQPRSVDITEGSFEWDNTVIVVEAGNEADRFAAETLVEACRERQIPAPAVQSQEADESRKQIIIGDPCRFPALLKAMREEGINIPPEVADYGYVLLVTPRRILVAANTSAGVYYGVQTLVQLLPQKQESAIPCLKITDWTDIKNRGISMDLFCGEVYKQEWYKENIRRMAHYKLNYLVLYFEDAFLFPSHPDIGEDRDRLTPEEAKELVEFGLKHHVQIVPCYESPGHMERTLQHPNYQYLREGEETHQQKCCINLAHPDTYPLLRDLYTDLCKTFPAEDFYIGADEAFAIGTGRSKALADEIGKDNLFIRHLKLIRDICKEHGKRLVVAADPFEPDFFKPFGLENYGLGPLSQLPRDIIIDSWHYGEVPEFEFGEWLVQNGFDQHHWTSSACYYHLYPAQNAAAVNVQSYLPWSHRLKASAVVHSEWNGYGENTFSEYNWPAIAFFAEWVWAAPGRSWEEALPLVVESFYGPGTGALADAIRFLADDEKYFKWATIGISGACYRLFFSPLEPWTLGKYAELRKDQSGVERDREPLEQAMETLNSFRRNLAEAREKVKEARSAATRNREHLDYIEHSLDQHEILADLVECRHLMAQDDPESRRMLDDMLNKLKISFPKLMSRYEELWLRVSRPLGLELNKKRFMKVWEPIKAYPHP